MKLRNSMAEDDVKKEIYEFGQEIRNSEQIMLFLSHYFDNVTSAYCWHWTPEQGEDILQVVINGEAVISYERSRVNDHITNMKLTPVEEYTKKYVKGWRMKLKMTLILALAKHKAACFKANNGTF